MNNPLTPREQLAEVALKVILATAFPRLAYRLRWPTRLGPGGLLAYIAALTLFGFGVRQFLMPRAKRLKDQRDQLTEELGRDPTDDEFADRFGHGPTLISIPRIFTH